MEVFYRSDLYEAGRSEDGEVVLGEAFYVVVELEDGRRFAHEAAFRSVSWVACEDADIGGYYDCDVEGAEAKAARLADRVAAAGEVDLAHWSEIDARYGSVAYQSQEAAA